LEESQVFGFQFSVFGQNFGYSVAQQVSLLKTENRFWEKFLNIILYSFTDRRYKELLKVHISIQFGCTNFGGLPAKTDSTIHARNFPRGGCVVFFLAGSSRRLW
jgi:hypothetical protein